MEKWHCLKKFYSVNNKKLTFMTKIKTLRSDQVPPPIGISDGPWWEME